MKTEVEGGGEADGAYRAQRVLGEGLTGVEWCAQQARLDIGQAEAGKVGDLAVPIAEQCIAGEVTANDVFCERARTHLRFTALGQIALRARRDKLDYEILERNLGGAEAFEDNWRAPIQPLPHRLRQRHSLALLGDHVEVLALASQNAVTHVAADEQSRRPELRRLLAECVEDRLEPGLVDDPQRAD